MSSHNVGSMKRHGSMSSHTRTHHGEISHHELSHTLPAHHHYDAEWEAKEELRLRELEEARARTAQMEKTMRWWSDCTANWREKWSKVRTERNKSREESRILRTKLESSLKECSSLKREKQDVENELEVVRNELKFHRLQKGSNNNVLKADVPQDVVVVEQDKNYNDFKIQRDGDDECVRDVDAEETPASDCKTRYVQTSPVHVLSSLNLSSDSDVLEKLWSHSLRLDGEEIKDGVDGDGQENAEKDENESSEKFVPENVAAEQRASMLHLHLEEATKTIQMEREEKIVISKCTEKLQEELNELKVKYDNLKQTKQETLKELNQLKANHQDELINFRLNLEDEANSRSSMDRRLGDLRSQLESLQAENAAEWGKRERLETEKLTLERDNKKLRTQIDDLEERLDRRNKQFTAAADSDLKALHQEIYDKNKDFIPGISTLKELADLKHAHNKLKKVLQDKLTELGHSVRRSEQYETEVKKLRARVEELKKELATAEDEVDNATNNIRKLQRTNDELQEQVDGLQVQVEHLQTRLRNTNHSFISRRVSPGRHHSANLSEDEINDY